MNTKLKFNESCECIEFEDLNSAMDYLKDLDTSTPFSGIIDDYITEELVYRVVFWVSDKSLKIWTVGDIEL